MAIGIDLGGTKIEVIALDAAGVEVLRCRTPTPRHDYGATLAAIAALVAQAEARLGGPSGVGVAIPGCPSRQTGLIKNANSTWLNGRPLAADLMAATGRPVRLANDANCFTLSEATDGAGRDAANVFGVIAGTGVGGGIAVGGRVLEGAHGIAGEWGHNPLPRMDAAEIAQAPQCYCGRRGCIETWISGPGLAADFLRATGRPLAAEEIAACADAGARAAIERFSDRFARALALIVNILDPDVIVLGGGLSNIDNLYRTLPALVERHTFGAEAPPRIVKNRHGDSRGVRGAAWLAPPAKPQARGRRP
jgi:fructokinase